MGQVCSWSAGACAMRAGLGVLPTAPIPWPWPLATTQHIQCFIDQKQQRKIQRCPCARAPRQAVIARPQLHCCAPPWLGWCTDWVGLAWGMPGRAPCRGGSWHGAAPWYLWSPPPALTDGMDVVGLGEGFGVGGQKRGYRGAWECPRSSMGNDDPSVCRAVDRRGMGRTQLPNPMSLLPTPLWQVPAFGMTPCDTRGCPLYLDNRRGRWEVGEWAQSVT